MTAAGREVAMAHQAVQEQETVERYVRNQLGADERRAFEEHFFSCDECFRDVETADRFVAAVRHAAAAGRLGAPGTAVEPRGVGSPWWRPAWVVGVAAALVAGI